MATNVSRLSLALTNTTTRAAHVDVEIHTVDTSRRIVLHTKINMLADAETEVASLREVLITELILLNLEAPLEDLGGLLTADGDVAGDLLITTDTERADGITS